MTRCNGLSIVRCPGEFVAPEHPVDANIARLERLAVLLREGILTEDEFEDQKAALLAQR